jgi:CheY-like chemotaxis protein
MLGGSIGVESEPGVGSTFYFTAVFGRHAASLRDGLDQSDERLVDLPVLIVDDNATDRNILIQTLRGWKMKPCAVGGCVAAIQTLHAAQARGQPFRLAILDGMMPDIDGYSVARLVRQDLQLQDTVLVMLTSAADGRDVARCRDLGVAAHMTKPVDSAQLYDTIRLVLGMKAVRPDEETGADPPLPAGYRILLAEDNAVNCTVATRLLEKQGHTVVTAENGRQALERIDAETFDLVLMDVQMPGMDGLETTRRIRSNELLSGRHLPIIALTAHALTGDRERCRMSGMDGFVTKPIRAAQLLAAIARALGGRRLDEPVGVTRGRNDREE